MTYKLPFPASTPNRPIPHASLGGSPDSSQGAEWVREFSPVTPNLRQTARIFFIKQIVRQNKWCPRPESNRHGVTRKYLKLRLFTLFSNTYLIFCSANSSKLQPWKTYKCYRVGVFAVQNELFCRCYFFTPAVSNVVFCHCYGIMAKLILCTHQVSVFSFV